MHAIFSSSYPCFLHDHWDETITATLNRIGFTFVTLLRFEKLSESRVNARNCLLLGKIVIYRTLHKNYRHPHSRPGYDPPKSRGLGE